VALYIPAIYYPFFFYLLLVRKLIALQESGAFVLARFWDSSLHEESPPNGRLELLRASGHVDAIQGRVIVRHVDELNSYSRTCPMLLPK